MDKDHPEELMRRLFEGGSLYLQLMKTMVEATEKPLQGDAGRPEKDSIYEKLSEHYLELYQSVIGKYLKAPQFGIQNDMLQKILAAIDAQNRLTVWIGEFILKFNRPLLESMGKIRQTIEDKEAAGEELNSAQASYDVAAGILEKKYDAYLKSAEGTTDMARIVEQYMNYKEKMNAAADGWYRTVGIPTRNEMAGIFRSVYDLRKRYRQLSRRLDGISGNAEPKKKNKTRSSRSKRVIPGNHEIS